MNNISLKNPETAIRDEIAILEKEIRKRGGVLGGSKKCSDELHLRFLQNVMAVEDPTYCSNPYATPRPTVTVDLKKEFRKRLKLPKDPHQLDERALGRKLREMIHLLARFHLKLENTDHLDDLELYHKILDHVIEEPLVFELGEKGTLYHQEICPCDDFPVYMRFYADDMERESYAEEMGDKADPLPPKEALKANRDAWIASIAEQYRMQPLPKN